MLARIAHELFWLGRNLARAEHTARMYLLLNRLDWNRLVDRSHQMDNDPLKPPAL